MTAKTVMCCVMLHYVMLWTKTADNQTLKNVHEKNHTSVQKYPTMFTVALIITFS